jgi:general secretion pathway protein B
MSYILEALKKAQAERQLGNAPTLHAPQVQTAQPGVAASRKPLLIGLGAGALVVALGALLVWQRTSAPAVGGAAMPAVAGPAAVPVAPAAVPTAPAAAGPGLAADAPAGAARPAAGSASNTLEVSAPPAPEPASASASAPASAPASARPAHVAAAPTHATPSGAGRAGNDTPPSTAPARSPAMAEATAPAAPAPRAAPSPASAAAPAPEDSLPYLRQLPDTIQRDIPRVSFGGYMYSANPADRLLLVDKTLRHEGEEVGPGLVLEKLLPKAAVMNFRGIRYRVPY